MTGWKEVLALVQVQKQATNNSRTAVPEVGRQLVMEAAIRVQVQTVESDLRNTRLLVLKQDIGTKCYLPHSIYR